MEQTRLVPSPVRRKIHTLVRQSRRTTATRCTTHQGPFGGYSEANLLNSNSKVSVDSLEAGSNRHCFMASSAALMSIGLPPTTRVFTTRPSAEIVASILTLPEIFISLASVGYLGSTFVRTLRLLASAATSCADAFNGKTTDPPTSNAITSAANASLSFMSLYPSPVETTIV
jgi:hypothetical protein